MTGRYARLRDEWQMRGWTDLPFAVMNWKTADIRPFSDRLEYVTRGCDGETDFDSMLYLPVHRAILDKLIENGIAEACSRGDAIADEQRFCEADNPYLDGIHWAVTGRCNMHCRHCYMESPGGGYSDLDEKDIELLIDRFKCCNLPQVNLTGGEPFMREDIFDIIRRLLAGRIRIKQIYTNGLLVTDKVLETCLDLGIDPVFCLSFDGIGTHDYMRGTKGSEARVLETIQRIRQAGYEVNIATSIDQRSSAGLLHTYSKLRDLSVRSWQISPPLRTGNWRTSTTALSLDEEIAIYQPLLTRWQEDGCRFELQLGALFNSKLQSAGNETPSRQLQHKPRHFACGVCRRTPYLMPDGTLLPCHMFAGSRIPGMPNLLTENLSMVWRKSRIKEITETLKKDILDHNKVCAGCDLFGECGTGCRARAFSATGDILARDPFMCEMIKGKYHTQLLGLSRPEIQTEK